MPDVVVVGAGLGGLSAAHDLAAAGADVLVLEARDRVGGRVEQALLPDGRPVQLGGEVVGNAHHAYLGLAAELGLELVPSYVAEPGEITRGTVDGVDVGEHPGWFTDADRAADEAVRAALSRLVATIDPDDPWTHPDLVALDAVSQGDWLRAHGATPGVLRLCELVALGGAGGSIERVSMFGQAWMLAVGGSRGEDAAGSYDYGQWENLRLAEGSARLPLLLAEGLGDRVRLGTPVAAIDVDGPAGGCTVTTAAGEQVRAPAVVCAVPVGPLRDIAVTGVDGDRLARLRRRRHALAAKFVAAYPEPFWRSTGQNGLSENDGVLGSTWPQSPGILSALVPPERLAAFAATEPSMRDPLALAEIARLYGDRALAPEASWVRMWGLDPWTQGYVAAWMPGDLAATGPEHGSHQPPFYVAGSDHWVCGYMEGAVRTGRAAAAEILARG